MVVVEGSLLIAALVALVVGPVVVEDRVAALVAMVAMAAPVVLLETVANVPASPSARVEAALVAGPVAASCRWGDSSGVIPWFFIRQDLNRRRRLAGFELKWLRKTCQIVSTCVRLQLFWLGLCDAEVHIVQKYTG